MSQPWMKLYIGDYLRDTTALTTAEHGAYMLLLMHYYVQAALPTDDASLAQIARLPLKDWRKMRSKIAGFFGKDWKHGRVEKELAEAKDKSGKASTSAKLRWEGHANAQPNAYANGDARPMRKGMRKASEPDASQKSESESQSSLIDSSPPPRPTDRPTANEIYKKLCAAAENNVAECVDAYKTQAIEDLMAMGCDLERDILPVIKRAVPKLQTPLRKWSARWLRDEILAAKTANEAKGVRPPPAGPTVDLGSRMVWAEPDVRAALARYSTDGRWPFPWREPGDLTGIPEHLIPEELRQARVA